MLGDTTVLGPRSLYTCGPRWLDGPYRGLEALEPRLCLATFAFETTALPTGQYVPLTLSAADIDDDGTPDILAALESDVIRWYENTGQLEGFISHDVGTGDDVYAAIAVDIDGDLDLDVVTGSEEGNLFAWFENDGGLFYGEDPNNTAGDGWPLMEMLDVSDESSPTFRFGTAVAVGDLDSDGDVDIIGAYRTETSYGLHAELVWFANQGRRQGFTNPILIAKSDLPIDSLSMGDVDGDGDLDIAGGASSANSVSWFENSLGAGQAFERHDIGIDWARPDSVSTVDLDLDGDLDIAAAARDGGYVGWHENRNGRGDFGLRTILVGDLVYPKSIDFKDLSNDGTLDLLVADGRDTLASYMVWYLGRNGPLSFHARSLIVASSILSATITAADIDEDGDLDVLGGATIERSSDRLVIFEQRMIGDIDGDGRFNSSDLREVLANGEYEDGLFRNSTFDEGDWNGDDEFTSSDLVLALQAGHYESAAAVALDQALLADISVATTTRRPWLGY